MIVVRITSRGIRMLTTLRIWFSRGFAYGIIISMLIMGQRQTFGAAPIPSHPLWAHPEAVIGSAQPRVETSLVSAQKKVPVRRVAVIRRPTNPTICLAQNLFFEAKNEPMSAIEAVAATVFNRMSMKYYPSSVCGVVYAPYQYSWTLTPSNWQRMPPSAFIVMANHMLQNRAILQEMYPVTHFHRVDIKPRWAVTMNYMMTIGQHKFYGT